MSDNSNITISEPFTLTSDYDICKECRDQELRISALEFAFKQNRGNSMLLIDAEVIFQWLKSGELKGKDESAKSDTSGLG